MITLPFKTPRDIEKAAQLMVALNREGQDFETTVTENTISIELT
ncbi:MAG: hypothetical protein VW338_15850 [Rhodospirillaceae bacterium]